MPIKALAPWFGSKRTIAPAVVELLGPHISYWEPFCGSMAVLLAKPVSRFETVLDLHGDLINLAHVVADRELSLELFEKCSRTLMHEGLFRESAAQVAIPFRESAPDLERAWHYFVVSWMGRGGIAGTPARPKGQYAGRYTNKGGQAGTRWRSAVASIPAWFERLRGVVIMEGSAFDVLPKIEDAAGTVMYVDPPYVSTGHEYQHGFTEADHRRLADLLGRFRKTRVVVSYYPHALVSELYPSPAWHQATIKMPKSLAAMGSRGKQCESQATELLLVNGPILGVLWSETHDDL